jgi:hypothetical protein
MFSFDVNTVEPLDECVKLLLMLSEGSLAGQDVCLTLVKGKCALRQFQ